MNEYKTTMTEYKWIPIDIIPVPKKYRRDFVAHSVVMTPLIDVAVSSAFGLPSPELNEMTWGDFSQKHQEKGIKLARETSLEYDEQIITSTKFRRELIETTKLADILHCKKGDAIVILMFGSIIKVPADAKFRAFQGFTSPNSHFAIPTHRFRKPLINAATSLAMAEEYWRDFCNTKSEQEQTVAAEALNIMNEIGYPPPGVSESDGNVIATWTNPANNALIPLIQLAGCGEQLSSLPIFGHPGKKMFKYYKGMVDSGREYIRDDFLVPSIADVVFV